MGRQKVVAFIQSEIKRLRQEQHIDDLIKANCFEELSMVKCQTVKAVSDFWIDEKLQLTDEEIPLGGCSAIAIWVATCTTGYNEDFFADSKCFAHRWAKEAGAFGKSGAFQMLDGEDLCDIYAKDFFSDKYAQKYDGMYGIEKD